jgi:LysM repeat protein
MWAHSLPRAFGSNAIAPAHNSLFSGNASLKRALAPASTVIAALAFSSPSFAADLIRCPDWASYVPKSAPIALRTSAPAESFEDRIALAIETADASSSGKRQPWSATHPSVKTKAATLNNGAGGCKTYKVRVGDTLGKIAARELGDSKRHPQLLAANKGKVKSAETLRIGTVLTIPCAGSDLQAAATPQKRAPWWKAQPKMDASPKATAVSAPEVTLKPAPAPLPRWSARQGEYLSDVLKRWGKKAGYTVILDGPAEWKLGVKFSEVGTFEDVIQQLVKGFARDGLPPSVRIHSNKVLKIGASS